MILDAERGRCVLCGSSNGEVVLQEGGYAGRACACGVVYIDPHPGSLAVDPTHDMHVDDYYERPARDRMEWIERFRGPCRLLEVGGGTGHLLQRARDRGYQVAAIEPNPECASGLEALGIPVERRLVEESEMPDGSADVVFHVDLLSHFPDPVRALRAMKRIASPGGLLCFEVGVFGGLARGWYPWIGRPGFPEHLWFYSESAIESVMERAGLEIVERKRFGLFPSTILSSVGRRLFGRTMSQSGSGAPAPGPGAPVASSGLGRHYGHLQYLLRYRWGARIPAWGPHALFVTARAGSDRG